MSGIKKSEGKAAEIQKEILIYDLCCSGLERAEGIEDPDLRFSWKIKEAGDGEVNQSVYEIQILKGGQVLYDTGKKVQRESKNVHVKVPGLISSDKYEFRIKIWDERGRESPWSEKAVFLTGILDRKDWHDARLIIADDKSVNYMTDSVWYRKQIFVKESVSQAVLHVAGIGIHEAYINGEKIGERVLAPAKSKINDLTRVMYVTYDVTAYLHEGENMIGIWNDAYWARQPELPVDPAVKCLLKIKEKNGSQIFVSGTDWECRASNISHRGGWEWSDFGGEVVRGTSDGSWCTISSPLSDWFSVRELEICPALTSDLTGGSTVCEIFSPVNIDNYENKTIVDFGKNFTGWIKIKLKKGIQGQKVLIKTADKNSEECTYNQISEFVFTEPDGIFCNKFNFAAGRYVTIEGTSQKFSTKDIVCMRIRHNMKKTGSFRCSIPLLNRIYDTDIETYEAATYDAGTVDCPHRERLCYGEAGISTYWGIGLNNFHSEALYEHVFRNWKDCQRKDGSFPNVAPNIGGAGGTTWNSSLLICLADYYRYTGNKKMIEKYFPVLEKWADFLIRNINNGILQQYTDESNFIGDWAFPEQPWGTSVLDQALFFNNCVAAYDLRIMMEFASLLAMNDLRGRYERVYREMCSAVHRQYYHPDRGVYFDGKHNNMAVAVCAGIVPHSEQEKVYAAFSESLRNSKYIYGGSAGLVFIFRAVGEKLRAPGLLYDILKSRSYPGYGYFIEQDQNTWPELWDMQDMWGGSRIHTCYTGISGVVTRYFVGIMPGKNGIRDFVLRPFFPEDMENMHAEYDYGYGKIVINWQKTEQEIRYELTVPGNMTASIRMPAQYLILTGNKAEEQITVGAGMHTFTIKKQII